MNLKQQSALHLQSRELIFRVSLWISGGLIFLLVGGIFFTLLFGSVPSIKTLGIHFLIGTDWDPVSGHFGAVSFLTGTLLTSFLAVMLSLPFSMAVSLFLGEYFTRGRLSMILQSALELLAGIPSVIYGFWGLYSLVPIMQSFQMKMGATPYGVGIFTASLILAIMIIPYSAAISREVIQLVPRDLKEAAYSMGATRFEVLMTIVLPYARSGIFAGILLSMGRALGETMAVTMVIGNANRFPASLFDLGNTMASVIANEFTEATGDLYLSSLIELGLLLFLVTAIISFIGKKVIKRYTV